MRIASLSALLVLLSSSSVLASSEATTEPISTALEVNADQSINPAEARAPHQKRTFCYYFGTCALQSDVNNCGYAGYACPAPINVGVESYCEFGECKKRCATGYDYNYATGRCIDTDTDVFNCGTAGFVCSVTNAATTKCVAGKCYAGSCRSGFFLSSLGTCTLTVSTTNDVKNCGRVGNICPDPISVKDMATCTNGVCGLKCNTLGGYDYDPSTGTCRDVSSDVNNCGYCGAVCALTGAATTKCSGGTCYALTCLSGYTMGNYACNKIINTATDINNCGSQLNVCPTSYVNGLGSVCLAGVCQPTRCATGFAFNFTTKTCQNVSVDSSNCGAIGAVCSFPRGTGACVGGVCTLQSCTSGYTAVAGVCTAVNTATDIMNCGGLGKVCPTSYLNGVNPVICVNSACQPTRCNTGFAFNFISKICIDVSTDEANCGAVGTTCSFPNGSGSCLARVCTLERCNLGYTLLNGVCTPVNTTSDIMNCGGVGKICPTSFLNGVNPVICVNSACQPTRCNTGFAFDFITKVCIDITVDEANCGAVGTVCSFPNGVGSCLARVCTLASCNSGFNMVGGVCTPVNLTSDINNCGGIGIKCAFTNGVGSCVNSKCTMTTCNAGFTLANNACSVIDLQTDEANCGTVGNKCPVSYLNGGAGICLTGLCGTFCNPGYNFDLVGKYCRPVTADINNCGRLGNVCLIAGGVPGAVACVNGVCQATACASGFTKTAAGLCVAINTVTDPLNCGRIGNLCIFVPSGAAGMCQNSICVLTTCPAGYTIKMGTTGVQNVCVQNLTPSARARMAKREAVKKTLCPAGESACPIAGSASFANALAHHFSAQDQFSGIMTGAGGYECLDTQNTLESCGGCASTGEGVDCTSIRGAVGVGCNAGTCIVFSCEAGSRPDMTSSRCIRIHDTPSNRSRGHAARHFKSHQSSL